MKANKILLIVQAALMYAAQAPLYLCFFLKFFNEDLYDKVISNCSSVYVILSIVLIPICLANLVLSIVSIFKGDNKNPSLLVLILKCALIPWFILNFVMCFIFALGMLNPFLMLFMPIVVCILVGCTYLCMVTTSLPDIAFYVGKLRRKETTIVPLYVVSIVFMFIFCMDAIGALIFMIGSIKKE